MEQQKRDMYVNFLRALGSFERLSILEEIEMNGEITASEVEKKFFMEQSTASHHLNILRKANILFPRRAGRNIYYHINESNLDKFYRELMGNLRARQLKRSKKSKVK